MFKQLSYTELARSRRGERRFCPPDTQGTTRLDGDDWTGTSGYEEEKDLDLGVYCDHR